MAKRATKKTARKKKAGPKRTPAAKALVLDLAGVHTLPPQEYLPTRNDILNAYLGGGLLVGCFNEIAGDPGLFKTTFLVECAVDVINEVYPIAKDGVVLIFDREGRIKEGRVTTLGGPLHHPRWIHHTNQPYTLTIEHVFEECAKTICRVREHDLLKVKVAIEGTGTDSDRAAAYYADVLKTGKNRPAISKALGNKWNLLRTEDRTLIFVGIDSMTAMPSDAVMSVATKMKPESSNADEREVARREEHQTTNQPGREALSWSMAFRNCTWMDDRVVGVSTAQMRTRGLMKGSGGYSAPAVSSAGEFYGRVRIVVHPASGGALYQAPDGNILMTAKTNDDKRHQIGWNLIYRVKKTATGVMCPVPAFMLGISGTDRANTVFEYLASAKIIEAAGGWYSVNEDMLTAAGTTLAIGKFQRASFIQRLYAENIHAWARLIRWRVGKTMETTT